MCQEGYLCSLPLRPYHKPTLKTAALLPSSPLRGTIYSVANQGQPRLERRAWDLHQAHLFPTSRAPRTQRGHQETLRAQQQRPNAWHSPPSPQGTCSVHAASAEFVPAPLKFPDGHDESESGFRDAASEEIWRDWSASFVLLREQIRKVTQTPGERSLSRAD